MNRRTVRIVLYIIGWSSLFFGCMGAWSFALRGSQYVDRITAGLFVGGVICLWIGSELKS